MRARTHTHTCIGNTVGGNKMSSLQNLAMLTGLGGGFGGSMEVLICTNFEK
jgi:hypothetical protein